MKSKSAWLADICLKVVAMPWVDVDTWTGVLEPDTPPLPRAPETSVPPQQYETPAVVMPQVWVQPAEIEAHV